MWWNDHEALMKLDIPKVGESWARKVSFFEEKYKTKVCNVVELDLHHPFLQELHESFDAHVVWQRKAKEVLSQAILDCVLKIEDSDSPLWVFFFHWPTWVGKTEIVKALAETLFGDKWGLIKVNCELLSEEHKWSNLFWAPPWYRWSDKMPLLNNKSVTNAFDVAKLNKKLNKMIAHLPWLNILLVDEIEKAHDDVVQQFLSLIDEWKITTSDGEMVNFQNSIIIFTSNIGQKELSELKKRNPMWFTPSESSVTQKEWDFEKVLYSKFSPEFIGRVHYFVEFEDLTIDDCKEIIDIQLRRLNKYLLKYFVESHIQLEISPDVYEHIIQNGYSQAKGARNLIRSFKHSVKRYFIRLIHSEEFKKYYDYKWKIIVGMDIENGVFNYVTILDGVLEEKKPEPVMLLEHKNLSKQSMSLSVLNDIYATMSAFTNLQYLNLDSEIDMKDEIMIYAERLRNYGLSTQDIKNLKNRAYLEWLRDLVFLSDFTGFDKWDENIELFHPFDLRTIQKIVNRKMKEVYWLWHISKKKFILESVRGIIDIVSELMKMEDLTGSQTNQLLFYIKKTLFEEYKIQTGF